MGAPDIDRLCWLEEFYRAIRALWACQHALGQAHARGAPPEVRARLDVPLAQAMRRVERAMDRLEGRNASG